MSTARFPTVYEQMVASARRDLDQGYQHRIAEQVAAALDEGCAADVAYEPGDGTRYPLCFTPLDAETHTTIGFGAFAGMGRGAMPRYPAGATLVSLEGGYASCYAFNLSPHRGELHPSYVGEKLLRRDEGASSVALADLLTAISEARKP